MKNNYFFKQKRLLFFMGMLLLMLLKTGNVNAQQAISIIWDVETGCLIYDDKREQYVEDIYHGPCVRVCEYSTVTYSLTGNSSGWQNTSWNVAGGTIVSQSLTTCTVTWGSSGNATVSAAVTKADNTVQTEQICVEIIISPSASFGLMPDVGADYVEGCVDDTFNFVNTSQTNGGTALIAYYWDFDDGTTSSEFQPSHHFAYAGTYTVSLTVTNACNCKSTYKIKVHVGKGGFDIICPGVVCDGERASYTIPQEVIDGCASAGYNWSVIGGHIVSPMPYGPQILVDWDSVDPSGFGYVMLDATLCHLECAGISTAQIPVIQSHGTITGETSVCENEQNIYKLPQWPSTTFNWSIDPGSTGAILIPSQNPNEVILSTFSSSGTIVLTATYNNTLLNCGGTATLTINVLPRAEIQGQTAMCVNATEYYTLQGGYTGYWVLTGPDGTTTGTTSSFGKTFTVAGNYNLTVSGSGFCKPGQTVIVIRDKEQTPDAINGPNESCPGVAQTYTVNNTIAGTQIVWAVTGGTINGSNTGNSVSVTFAGPGPYTLQAWRESVTLPNCPSDIITKTVTAPVISLNITGPQIVCSSTYADYDVDYADAESYSWSVSPSNAGSVSSGNDTQHVSVLWNEYTGGTAYVVLNVTKCGIVQPAVYYPVQIITAPTVSLVNPASQVCQGQPLTLTLTSSPTLTSGTITWDFGDGNIVNTNSTMPNWLTATHSYTPTNSSNVGYTVTITVSNGNGCVNPAVVTHLVTVLPAPVASISPGGTYAICPMTSQVLTVNIQGGLSGVTNIEWYSTASSTPFASGATLTSTSVNSYGSYYAVVTGTNGCTTTTNYVTYNNNCNPNPPCQTGETVILNTPVNNCGVISVTASYTGTPTNITWFTTVNPLSSSTTNTSASFTFAESGSYTIYYQVTYGNCVVTKSQTVVVPYIPNLRYTITCGTGGGYSVTLLDNSNYYPGHPITSHIFHINSNNYPEGTNTSHTENLMPGTYTLGLTIDGTGTLDLPCSVTPITIVLPALPDPTFTFESPKCEDAVVHFDANATGSGLTYYWTFGDGASNRQENPQRVYENPSIPNPPYHVTLQVTNQYGCTVTHSEDVTITPNGLGGEIVSSADTACEGDVVTLTFNNTGTTTPLTYYWMKGNQQIGTTTAPANTFNVTDSGSYWVKVESALGCQLLTVSPVNVTFVNAPEAHISGPDAVCSGTSFVLSVPDAGPGATYAWRLLPGTSVISTINSVTQTLGSLGTYTYEVTVSIPNGVGGYCTNQDTHTVAVNAYPNVPSISIAAIDCDTYTFQLSASASGAGTYTWSNGMSGPVIQVTQGGAYQVTFTNPSGCSRSSQVDVPYDPAIHLWSVPDGCYTLCKEAISASFLTGTTATFNYWEWLVNSNPVNSGSNSPVSPINIGAYGPGTYQLMLNNGYCSRISDEVNIETQSGCDCDIKVSIRYVERAHTEYCAYDVLIEIDNPYGIAIPVTLSLPNGEGIFVPSTVTANPGYNAIPVVMIPLSGYLGGTTVVINFEAMLDAGKLCLKQTKTKFPQCGDVRRLAVTSTSLADSLILAPNPAREKVEIHYEYNSSKEGDARTLQIYSLMGVQLESYSAGEASGVWKADLSRYASGQYIVVMKLNGEVINQKNLILQ